MTKRGPKSVAENSRKRAAVLKDFASGKEVSYYHKRELVKLGFVVTVDAKSGNRGRPARSYEVSGKGRGYLALSKNW